MTDPHKILTEPEQEILATGHRKIWEQRFDEQFKNIYQYPDWFVVINKDLKSFISQELEKARESGYKEGFETATKQLTEHYEDGQG